MTNGIGYVDFGVKWSSVTKFSWVGCNIDLRHIPPVAKVAVVREGLPTPKRLIQSQWRRSSSIHARLGDHGWFRDVLACVEKLESNVFRLSDIYSFEKDLHRLHLANWNVRPKIRQQLQMLCSEGLVRRISPGVYQRVPVLYP